MPHFPVQQDRFLGVLYHRSGFFRTEICVYPDTRPRQGMIPMRPSHISGYIRTSIWVYQDMNLGIPGLVSGYTRTPAQPSGSNLSNISGSNRVITTNLGKTMS